MHQRHILRRQVQTTTRLSSTASGELPLVGIIDMENKDGTIYSGGDDSDLLEQHELAGVATVVYTGAASIEEVDSALLDRFSAVMLRRCPFGAPQLSALPKLRAILRMGAGYDNVDTEACSAAGVIACNCPDAWVEEVADTTLCLMVALIRRSFDLANFVAAGGGWTRQAELQQKRIKRIRGMKLGIVGLGRIGTAVSMRARAFGFELAFYDPYLPAGAEKGHGGMRRTTSFQELVETCDVISFHCPKTMETTGLLNGANMPGRDHPGLYVVNCGRGGVVDEEAVLAGLAQGRLLGVALDSVEGEPNLPRALLEAQASGEHNLLITPHAAFYSDEAFQEMRVLAAREIRRILSSEPAQYQVN
eukprot:COSAG05_NODE_28_length_29121_cov_56.951933_25_plen_362_part_00